MYNPIRKMTDKASQNNKVMQYWMSGYGTGRGSQGNDSPGHWVPTTDVIMREGGDLEITMELPGVRREDINVSLAGGDLTVSGQKDGRDESAEYYTSERYSGPFQRTVSLPDGLTRDRISCNFERGTLEIMIRDYARTLEAEAERLEVQGPGD